MRPAACDLRSIIEEVAELLAARASAKHLELACDVLDTLPRNVTGVPGSRSASCAMVVNSRRSS
jgi:signal transduction histidine kinase